MAQLNTESFTKMAQFHNNGATTQFYLYALNHELVDLRDVQQPPVPPHEGLKVRTERVGGGGLRDTEMAPHNPQMAQTHNKMAQLNKKWRNFTKKGSIHLYALNHELINLRVVQQQRPPVPPLVLHEGLKVSTECVGSGGLRARRGLLAALEEERQQRE